MDQLTVTLQRFPDLRAAWLFGSRASGRARFDSDIDLAVLGSAPLTPEQRRDLIEAVVQATGTPVDLIDLAVEHGYVAREALLKGKLLFCKDHALYRKRLRELVYDAEDFLPALRSAQVKALRQWIRT